MAKIERLQMSGLLSGKGFVCVCVSVCMFPFYSPENHPLLHPPLHPPRTMTLQCLSIPSKLRSSFFLLTSFNIIMLSLSQRKKKPLGKLPQRHFLNCKVIYLFAYQFSCLLRVFTVSDFSICSKPHHHGIISESTCQHLSRNLFLYLPGCISWQNVFLIMFLLLLNIDSISTDFPFKFLKSVIYVL